jgi:general secretion pathway protein G
MAHLKSPVTKPFFSSVGRVSRRLQVRHEGFTLLELLVVIVIIGMLASYVGPKYFAQLGKSEVATARAQLDALSKAVETFRLDVGRYPTSSEGLNALTNMPESARGWNGPYLKKAVPMDPWQNAYVYQYPVKNNDYLIQSYGKDGKPGGQDQDADLSN